jgi:hypothetical protein
MESVVWKRLWAVCWVDSLGMLQMHAFDRRMKREWKNSGKKDDCYEVFTCSACQAAPIYTQHRAICSPPRSALRFSRVFDCFHPSMVLSIENNVSECGSIRHCGWCSRWACDLSVRGSRLGVTAFVMKHSTARLCLERGVARLPHGKAKM